MAVGQNCTWLDLTSCLPAVLYTYSIMICMALQQLMEAEHALSDT